VSRHNPGVGIMAEAANRVQFVSQKLSTVPQKKVNSPNVPVPVPVPVPDARTDRRAPLRWAPLRWAPLRWAPLRWAPARIAVRYVSERA